MLEEDANLSRRVDSFNKPQYYLSFSFASTDLSLSGFLNSCLKRLTCLLKLRFSWRSCSLSFFSWEIFTTGTMIILFGLNDFIVVYIVLCVCRAAGWQELGSEIPSGTWKAVLLLLMAGRFNMSWELTGGFLFILVSSPVFWKIYNF